jgi:hypothetical protein
LILYEQFTDQLLHAPKSACHSSYGSSVARWEPRPVGTATIRFTESTGASCGDELSGSKVIMLIRRKVILSGDYCDVPTPVEPRFERTRNLPKAK